MKGSGKQVLLRILSELSTRVVPDDELPEATRRLRAGLLLHGSTADESFESASRLAWASQRDPKWGLTRQGIAVGSGKVFLTDLYESIFSMDGLQEHIMQTHPSLDSASYEAFEWVMWLLVSSVQMYSQLAEVENVDELNVEEWVDAYSRHYENHFRRKSSSNADE